jgi:hypothetical protein
MNRKARRDRHRRIEANPQRLELACPNRADHMARKTGFRLARRNVAKGKKGGAPYPSPLTASGARGLNGRWRAYTCDEIAARDKVSLDIFWLRDESLEDSDNLPHPDVMAQEIVERLEAALEHFRLIVEDLNGEKAQV